MVGVSFFQGCGQKSALLSAQRNFGAGLFSKDHSNDAAEASEYKVYANPDNPKENRDENGKGLVFWSGGIANLQVPNCNHRKGPQGEPEFAIMGFRFTCFGFLRMGYGNSMRRKEHVRRQTFTIFGDNLLNSIRSKISVIIAKAAVGVKQQTIIANGNLFDLNFAACCCSFCVFILNFANYCRVGRDCSFCQRGGPNQLKLTASQNHSTYSLSSLTIQTRGRGILVAGCHTGRGVVARMLCPSILPVGMGAGTLSRPAPAMGVAA